MAAKSFYVFNGQAEIISIAFTSTLYKNLCTAFKQKRVDTKKNYL